jgi:hypothetical protein
MEKGLAACETGEDAQASNVDILAREEEEVDAEARFGALFGDGAVERLLRRKEGALLVGAVELIVLAMLERAGSDGGQGCLEDVDLAAEVSLQRVG